MAGQEQHRDIRKDDEGPDDVSVAPPAPSTGAQERDAQVDALLDEIDEVLESNAESFVRGFVQKGGQ